MAERVRRAADFGGIVFARIAGAGFPVGNFGVYAASRGWCSFKRMTGELAAEC